MRTGRPASSRNPDTRSGGAAFRWDPVASMLCGPGSSPGCDGCRANDVTFPGSPGPPPRPQFPRAASDPGARTAHPPAPPSWPRPSDNLCGPPSLALRVAGAVAQRGSAGERKPEPGSGTFRFRGRSLQRAPDAPRRAEKRVGARKAPLKTEANLPPSSRLRKQKKICR